MRSDADSLAQALADRKVIERAKGLLMEREKLGEAELSVEETIALLREGKGLEQALRTYLEKAEKDLEQIEKGKGLTAFVIEDPADGPA
mgnify:CR=1 FL=1